ncbi:MAG: SPASM domain-containing protein [Candidatus Thorarchaeota archaeon]
MKLKKSGNPIIQTATEFHFIYHRFYKELENIGTHLLKIIPNIKGSFHSQNILILLPYWLLEFVENIPSLNKIRALSLGNLFGSLYCLTQDNLMDKKLDQNAQPLLNIYYYKWLKEYGKVFSSQSHFWLLFEKYLIEYCDSIYWEKREHWGKVTTFSEKDFKFLGKKAAPLKMCCSAICLMDNKLSRIPEFSQMIDDYHVGFQLADDIADWKEDLAAENFTYLLLLIHNQFGKNFMTEKKINQVLKATDLIERVLEKSYYYYKKSLEQCKKLNCPPLEQYIKRTMNKNNDLLLKYMDKDKKNKSVKLLQNIIDQHFYVKRNHIFNLNNKTYLYLIDHMDFFQIDHLTGRILKYGKEYFSLKDILPLLKNEDKKKIKEIILELSELKIIKIDKEEFKTDSITPVHSKNWPINSITIQLNLKKENKNVFISEEILMESVHFLFKMGYRKSLSLTFLLSSIIDSNLEKMIINIINYTEQMAEKLRKDIKFFIKMDHLILEDEKSMNFLFSLKNLKGIIVKIIEEIPQRYMEEIKKKVVKDNKAPIVCLFDEKGILNPYKSYSVRDTGNKVVKYTNLSTIFQSLHFKIPQKHFCNAGKASLAIDIKGNIYPCFKFMEFDYCKIGNISKEIWQKQSPYLKAHTKTKKACSRCWVKNICGGGCMFKFYEKNKSLTRIDPNWCKKFQTSVEKTIESYSQFQKKGGHFFTQNNFFENQWPSCGFHF